MRWWFYRYSWFIISISLRDFSLSLLRFNQRWWPQTCDIIHYYSWVINSNLPSFYLLRLPSSVSARWQRPHVSCCVVVSLVLRLLMLLLLAVVGPHVGKTCFTKGFARLQLSKGLLQLSSHRIRVSILYTLLIADSLAWLSGQTMTTNGIYYVCEYVCN